MMPRIRKVEPQDLCDGMHIMGYKYKVSVGKVNYFCFTKWQAIKVWLKQFMGFMIHEELGTCELCRKAIYEESDFHMDSEGVELCDECYQEIMKE